MKILIAGIGATGKSTLRRTLVKALRFVGETVEQYDADDFKTVRCGDDADCRRPESFQNDVLYIIEDVRGTTTGKSFLPIYDYDFIIYVEPKMFSYILFWLQRLWRWFQSGKFSWDREKGWKGTQKPNDFRNCLPITREFLRQLKNRQIWIRDDMEILYGRPYIIVRSIWSTTKIRWEIITPLL